MHPLVRAILLRVGRQNPLVLNPQAQPPHVERRQAMERGRGERHAVVGTNRAREAVLPKQALEDRSHAGAPRGQQAVAAEQIAGVLIGDGQRIAVAAVVGAELAFEVGRPQVVRGVRHRWHDAGMMERAPAAAALHQPAAGQQVPGGADGGPRHVGVARRQPLQQLLGAPIRMLAAGPHEQVGDGGRDLVRTGVRRSAPIDQRRAAPGVVAPHPLVARLPADGVSGAELGHRVEPEQVVIDEAIAFFHRCRLPPGHLHLR